MKKTLEQQLYEIQQGKIWEIGKRFIPINQDIIAIIKDTIRDTKDRIKEHLCEECKKKI